MKQNKSRPLLLFPLPLPIKTYIAFRLLQQFLLMGRRINSFLLVLVVLLIPLLSGTVEGIKNEMVPSNSFHQLVKNGIQMNNRKLLMLPDAILDYDDAGANVKHDPRKKPGNGSGKP